MSACRDKVFDSQEIDDEENNIPGAGSSNDMNIQVVNDDERGDEAEVDEAEESGEDDDDLLHVPSRKRKLISPVWDCGAAVKIDGGSKCTLCGKQFISQTFNTSNIIKHIMDKHKDSEASAKLKEEMEVKKRKLREDKRVKEEKLKESKKLCQSSMLTFTTKALPIDPLKKKRIEEAIIKHVIVEN